MYLSQPLVPKLVCLRRWMFYLLARFYASHFANHPIPPLDPIVLPIAYAFFLSIDVCPMLSIVYNLKNIACPVPNLISKVLTLKILSWD